jgi:long-chain acyl-CoA synthetase
MQNCCHFSVLIHEQAKKYGEKTALSYRDYTRKEWIPISWNKFSANVKKVSGALLELGIGVQENMAIFSQNLPQYIYTDFGAFGVRAVTVPIYATSSEEQLQYIINDAQVRFLFVGEQEQYDKAHRVFALCPSLERIIIYTNGVRVSNHDPNAMTFDDFLKLGEKNPHTDELNKLYMQANYEDTANILYTSGTTGESKGVVLSHGQFHAAMIGNGKSVAINENDIILNFLPFTHIFERGWSILALSEGSQLAINQYPKDVQMAMKEVHPTSMCSVPRFWEKVFIAIQSQMEVAGAVQKALFKSALKVGHKYNIDYLSKGKRPPLGLRIQYALFNRTVFSLVRNELGLEHPNIFPTAGAAVNPEVEEFIHSIGIYMMVGYGMTESLATVSNDNKDKPYTIGSVGRLLPGVQVKIGENDEILLKGPTIFKQYYHKESLTKQCFDADGWFHTGDAGYMKDGELFLKERIKDLFKTSNGKYIAPQMIESKLLVDKYIDQVAVIADQYKFVSALIIPEYRLIEQYAKDNNIKYDSREDLCKNKQIYDMLMERIETLQQSLANYEKIKRFILLPHHFSMEKGELTNTLKIKRAVLNHNYAAEIASMYEDK